MRKRILLIVVSAFLLSFAMLAVSVSAAPAVEGRKTCVAYLADIEVDGEIDDAWAYADEVSVDIVKQNASAWYGDESKVAGEDYATLTCKVLWNGDETLYVLYIVNDKTVSMIGQNEWLRDSIELFVQLDNEANNPAAIKDQLRFFADGTVSAETGIYFETGFSQDGDTLIFEVRYDNLYYITEGSYIGIDFQYNDDAEGTGERSVCLGWSDTTDKASTDVTVYGQCELSDVSVKDLMSNTAEETTAEETTAEETTAEETTAEETTAEETTAEETTAEETTAEETTAEETTAEETTAEETTAEETTAEEEEAAQTSDAITVAVVVALVALVAASTIVFKKNRANI